jgi:hypothetical protein
MATQRTTPTAAHDLVIRDGLVVEPSGTRGPGRLLRAS